MQIEKFEIVESIFPFIFEIVLKSISIFLLIVYLVSTTQMIELLKLPVLVEHFKEHQRENPSITLLRFLDMHYMHGCPKDNDYDRDMQLPFKVPTHSILATVDYIVPATVVVLVNRQPAVGPIQNFARRISAYSFNYLSAIWQPPRTA